MDLTPLPNYTFDQYCRECAGIIDVKNSDAMTADNKNLVVYDLSRFKRDTALRAWKR